jgi:hypothetical protein
MSSLILARSPDVRVTESQLPLPQLWGFGALPPGYRPIRGHVFAQSTRTAGTQVIAIAYKSRAYGMFDVGFRATQWHRHMWGASMHRAVESGHFMCSSFILESNLFVSSSYPSCMGHI